jgi:anaerobic selenocysteine-containing dehydrogenase
MITVAGNPVLSTPDAGRLDRALASLDFMVSVDIYRNETTRHANVILPPEGALARGHYDLAFYQLSIRNIANYSPPVIDLEPTEMAEYEILLRLAGIASGNGSADPAALDDLVVAGLVQKAVQRKNSNVEGRDPDELLATLSSRRGPERILDLMLRTGPYGDGFGADPSGLSLAALEAAPHGVDLGPLQPRIPEVLRTPSGKVELAPDPIVEDVERLRSSLTRMRDGEMVLVGRRDLRSNNSWMHNVDVLVKGKERCTLHLHPDDALRLGIANGQAACVRSRSGEVAVTVEVTDAIMPGVVSIPHGWGHGMDGADLSVAAKRPGVNSNLLAGGDLFDPLSGNAVLNGIPVRVKPLTAADVTS